MELLNIHLENQQSGPCKASLKVQMFDEGFFRQHLRGKGKPIMNYVHGRPRKFTSVRPICVRLQSHVLISVTLLQRNGTYRASGYDTPSAAESSRCPSSELVYCGAWNPDKARLPSLQKATGGKGERSNESHELLITLRRKKDLILLNLRQHLLLERE